MAYALDHIENVAVLYFPFSRLQLYIHFFKYGKMCLYMQLLQAHHIGLLSFYVSLGVEATKLISFSNFQTFFAIIYLYSYIHISDKSIAIYTNVYALMPIKIGLSDILQSFIYTYMYMYKNHKRIKLTHFHHTFVTINYICIPKVSLQ